MCFSPEECLAQTPASHDGRNGAHGATTTTTTTTTTTPTTTNSWAASLFVLQGVRADEGGQLLRGRAGVRRGNAIGGKGS